MLVGVASGVNISVDIGGGTNVDIGLYISVDIGVNLSVGVDVDVYNNKQQKVTPQFDVTRVINARRLMCLMYMV